MGVAVNRISTNKNSAVKKYSFLLITLNLGITGVKEVR